MDIVDYAQLREERERTEAIQANSADIPVGKQGDCDDCGHWSGRLIEGLCAPCRDLQIQRDKFRR